MEYVYELIVGLRHCHSQASTSMRQQANAEVADWSGPAPIRQSQGKSTPSPAPAIGAVLAGSVEQQAFAE